jgi:hypothetical protein
MSASGKPDNKDRQQGQICSCGRRRGKAWIQIVPCGCEVQLPDVCLSMDCMRQEINMWLGLDNEDVPKCWKCQKGKIEGYNI